MIGPLATILYRVPGLGPRIGWNLWVSHQNRGQPPLHQPGLWSQPLVQSVQRVEEVVLLNFVQKELFVAIILQGALGEAGT